MDEPGWKQACREACAYKGEPPCFTLDGHQNCEPCEDCEAVGALIDAKDAEIGRLRAAINRHADELDEARRDYESLLSLCSVKSAAEIPDILHGLRSEIEHTLEWINGLPIPTRGAAAIGMRLHAAIHPSPMRTSGQPEK